MLLPPIDYFMNLWYTRLEWKYIIYILFIIILTLNLYELAQ